MGLQAIQSRFALEVSKLIIVADILGYQVTFGDAYRDPRCNYGSAKSKHRKRLAIDLNLFKDGVWLEKTEDHAVLGAYWKSIGGIWGGDFPQTEYSTPDGNHYEWPEK